MTSDVTINSALDYAQSTANSSTQLAEDFDDFLILLTTQLQNQDPLSPMNSTEFTQQLVSFAGVEQQINANQKLNSLVSLGLGTAFSSALGYVGKDVSYLSAEVNFDGSTSIPIKYAISEGSPTSVTINILDEEGNTVLTKELSATQNTGDYTWDGKNTEGYAVEAGTYTVRVDALDAEDNSLKATTVVQGRVRGVETQNGSTMLLVGERAVSLGSIINVSEPATTDTDTTTDTTA